MGFLSGKRALITGLASKRSIAWGIADAMRREGAELAFTYQNEKLQKRVQKMAAELGSDIFLPLDVALDSEIEAVFSSLRKEWDGLDIIVHSVGFAPRECLAGTYIESVTREGFQIAHDISAYSFAALAKAALESSVRFMAADLGPRNIRVNAISAGPIKTLAASGVGNFRKLMQHSEAATPLKRNITIGDVGNASAFLCSDLASGITGEILHVDGGYSTVGMSFTIDEDEDVLA
jgi:enoyl-[acyl-carrier protein] reductase I